MLLHDPVRQCSAQRRERDVLAFAVRRQFDTRQPTPPRDIRRPLSAIPVIWATPSLTIPAQQSATAERYVVIQPSTAPPYRQRNHVNMPPMRGEQAENTDSDAHAKRGDAPASRLRHAKFCQHAAYYKSEYPRPQRYVIEDNIAWWRRSPSATPARQRCVHATRKTSVGLSEKSSSRPRPPTIREHNHGSYRSRGFSPHIVPQSGESPARWHEAPASSQDTPRAAHRRVPCSIRPPPCRHVLRCARSAPRERCQS